MSSIDKIERSLIKTRKTLYEVCRELGLDVPDRDELVVDQCTHCNTWNFKYKLSEDLDGNPICRYCEDLVGR
jgi:hypothetical protein